MSDFPTELSFVDFTCPYCAHPISFPEDRRGLTEECVNCRGVLVVPRPGVEVGGKLPLPINTPRLTLRRLAMGDWKDLLTVMSDEESFRYLEWQPLDEAGVLSWIERDRGLRLTDPQGCLYLALELRGRDQVLGVGQLRYPYDNREMAVPTVLVGAAHRRQGFGTEALRGMMDFAFQGIGVHRLFTGCNARNEAGCRLLAKAGMRHEGEFVEDTRLDGEWANTAWYAKLEKEHAQGS